MRGAILQREPFPFVVWWICWIDLYALFSGAGTGDFVRNLLAHDMIPAALSQLYPIGEDGKSIIFPGEEHTLPVMLRLNRDTFILAIRLGILAADCRRDAVSQTFPDGSIGCTLLGRAAKEKRLIDIQQSFVQLWTTPRVSLFQQQVHQLPPRSKEVFQHVRYPLHIISSIHVNSSACFLFYFNSIFSHYSASWVSIFRPY